MSGIRIWFDAFRLQTLPLALSCIFMASFLANFYGYFSWLIFAFATLTTLLLQILSNLANDYGDAEKGTDNENRIGPMRSIQSGAISKKQMKRAVIMFIMLSFFSGVVLLLIAFPEFTIQGLLFFGLGISAIAAALKYTIGKNAFAYSGLGDVFVLLFFGFVGVLGTYYLYANKLVWDLILPAMSVGVFSMGVLNLNNLRDIKNDEASGKNTIVVKNGVRFAKNYHLFLILIGWVCALFYTFLNWFSLFQLLFLMSLPVFVMNLKTVFNYKHPEELIPSLKQLALATFFFTLLFGLGLILSNIEM